MFVTAIKIILLVLVAWLAVKVFIRSYAIYKFIRNFINLKNAIFNQTNQAYNNTNAQGANKSRDFKYSSSASTNKKTSSNSSANKKGQSSRRAKKDINPKMVECEKCQVYIPESESVVKSGKHYCCKEHAEQKN